MGFEPTRAEHNGLAVHRLNHSATSSHTVENILRKKKMSFPFLTMSELGINLGHQASHVAESLLFIPN